MFLPTAQQVAPNAAMQMTEESLLAKASCDQVGKPLKKQSLPSGLIHSAQTFVGPRHVQQRLHKGYEHSAPGDGPLRQRGKVFAQIDDKLSPALRG